MQAEETVSAEALPWEAARRGQCRGHRERRDGGPSECWGAKPGLTRPIPESSWAVSIPVPVQGVPLGNREVRRCIRKSWGHARDRSWWPGPGEWRGLHLPFDEYLLGRNSLPDTSLSLWGEGRFILCACGLPLSEGDWNFNKQSGHYMICNRWGTV